MIGQKHCPFCLTPAIRGCEHLALAVEARELFDVVWNFPRDKSLGKAYAPCVEGNFSAPASGHRKGMISPGWKPRFCDEFLKRLSWFGEMDYEWRTGSRPEQGGFLALLWSKDPKRLWWELRDEFERQCSTHIPPAPPPRYDNFLPL